MKFNSDFEVEEKDNKIIFFASKVSYLPGTKRPQSSISGRRPHGMVYAQTRHVMKMALVWVNLPSNGRAIVLYLRRPGPGA